MPIIKASERISGAATAPIDQDWSRPANWLPMPTLADGDQKIAMLVAVYEHGANFLAFNLGGADYVVDWGDGSAPQNFTAGTDVEYNLAWASANPATETQEGYRQALVLITAQAGQTITSVNMSVGHSLCQSAYSTTVLDFIAAGAGIKSIKFYSASCYFGCMRRFKFVGTCNLDTMSSMFRHSYSLERLDISDTSKVTSMFRAFYYCTSLKDISDLDCTSCTNMNTAFYFCYALQNIKLTNTQNVANFQEAFRGGYSLDNVHPIDVSGATTLFRMFFQCPSLSSAELINNTLDIDYSGSQIGPDSINAIFTSCAVSTSNIDVSGNWGAATCDPTIATVKGWTVVTS